MFTARRLPQRMAPSGWQAILPQRDPSPPLEQDLTVDVAIIGGGVAGLAAARRLRQIDKTVRIAVVDALTIADGAAGRNSGFMIDLPHDVSSGSFTDDGNAKTKNEIVLNRLAISFAQALAAEQNWGKDIFDACGKYSFSTGKFGDEHLNSFAQELVKLAEAHQLLTAEEARKITGSSSFTSGLFTPGCMMLQPAAYFRAFAASLHTSVKFFENTPALGFERVSGAWQIKTPKAAINAGKVILACNGHAESFGLFQNRLLHVFTYASMTEPFDAARLSGERQWGATPAHPMGTTMRRLSGAHGDRLLIRSKYSLNPSITVSNGDIASAARIHDRKFADRFPMLRGVKMQHRWAGALALTWNGVPAFGELDKGLITACACNGVGLTKATLSGMAAAELASGQSSGLTAKLMAEPAPKRLPPWPIGTIGAKAAITYRRWRAGRE